MTLKDFSLGIIDVLGVMIPGIIWVSLFFYVHVLFPEILQEDFSKIFSELNRNFPNSTFVINTFIFIFASYLLGYLSRLVPPVWLDWLTLPLATFGTPKKFLKVWKVDGKCKFKDKTRPFDFIYKHQSDELMNLLPGVKDFSGDSEFFRPIFICKRFILQHSPSLWVEAERREAEIRLVNGLFYPTCFTSILFFYRGHFILGLILAMMTVFLAFMFRRRRYAEVSFLYGASLVVSKSFSIK